MPSGRGSSGGGGSHFSGGSSSFGGSGGGHRSYRRVSSINGRRVVYVDSKERFYLMGWADTTLRILKPIFFVALFCIIGVIMTWSASVAGVRAIEHNYNRYQNMIRFAENQRDNFDNDDFFVDGIVTSYAYNTGAKKYYLNYKFSDSNGQDVVGYTYSIYTLEEAQEKFELSIIELVVDDAIRTQMTDSINYDYKNMPKEKDGEYVFSMKFYNEMKPKVWTAISIGVAIIAAMIVVRITGKKKAEAPLDRPVDYPSYNNTQTTQNSTPMQYSQYQNTNTNQNTQTNTTEHQNTYQNKTHSECLDCDLNKEYYENKEKIVNNIKNKTSYCMYCGAPTTENVSKCPNCNADLNG